jgi:competence protein ComEC
LNAQRQPLLVVLIAAAVGIVADRAWGWGLAVWWSILAGGWLVWLATFCWPRHRWSAAPLLLAAAALAAAWHHCCWDLFAETDISRFARGPVRPAAVLVKVVTGPRLMPAPPRDPLRTTPLEDRTRLEVRIEGIRDGRNWQAAEGAALLLVSGELADVRAGDRLQVFCQLAGARNPDNPGEFDFAADARADRRQCLLRVDMPVCVSRTATGPAWSGRAIVDRLRSTGQQLLRTYIRPRYAGLAAATFLGIREDLQPEDSQSFLETGTIHLLVVSGLNVGILAATLLALLRLGLLPRGPALAAVAALTIIYACVTDLQPPVVRAAVMVLILCGARMLGRRTLAFNSLAAAALVVLAMNPADLFRTGPQLSFLATAVLCWLSSRAENRPPIDPLDRLIAQSRAWPMRAGRYLGTLGWRSLAASAVIWLVVCPLVMARFHLLSPVAILLGPILSLPVTLAMAAGLAIMATGGWLSPLAAVCGSVCERCLDLMARTVGLGQHGFASHFWVPGPSNWWLGGFYLALALWAGLPRFRPPLRWSLALCCGWIAIGLSADWVTRSRQDGLVCTVLSVGHGSAVVLELPGGRTLLYDAGRLGAPAPASRAVANFLWSRGRTHLDAVVLSHADADHYNALPALTKQFSIGVVYVSPVMFENPSAGLRALQQSLDAAGVTTSEVWTGDLLRTADDCRIEVLHPPRRGVLGSDNANSIVLAIEYAGRRLLLTGDLESPGLDDVLAEEPYDCDVLLAPHHGSAYSSAPRVAARCRPEWTIISGRPSCSRPTHVMVKSYTRPRTARSKPGFRSPEWACNRGIRAPWPAGRRLVPPGASSARVRQFAADPMTVCAKSGGGVDPSGGYRTGFTRFLQTGDSPVTHAGRGGSTISSND